MFAQYLQTKITQSSILECNFYGDDQMTKTTYDGKEYKVEEDKTGFMKGDTPAILDKALQQNILGYN